jgi:tRNA-Thr(GGU) m(6)t(6)A37 methyltransferase TsaA
MKQIHRKQFVIDVVGIAHSPFRQKFGIPRQPRLVPEAVGHIELLPPYDDPAMLDGIRGFSHLWLSFVFHHCVDKGWRKRVRPPRLGGNEWRGVFASRSPFRPNHLGLSAVELLGVEEGSPLRLRVGGMDLLDGTPIVDIKPYVPYADAVAQASGGFAATPPDARLEVVFAPVAAEALAGRGELQALIRAVLELDPRPAYRAGEDAGEYGMLLGDVDVRFRIADGVARVTALQEPSV